MSIEELAQAKRMVRESGNVVVDTEHKGDSYKLVMRDVERGERIVISRMAQLRAILTGKATPYAEALAGTAA